MPDKPVAIIISGGGGAPRIPPRQVGTPGVREVAEMCTGKEYDYLKGTRICRTCVQRRDREYKARKRVARKG